MAKTKKTVQGKQRKGQTKSPPKHDGKIESSRGKVKSDFPKHTLDEAMRVPKSLEEANGGKPLPPIETATALGMSPGSSEFRVLLSSSIKYGLTSGSFNQERVALTDLGRRIVEPTSTEEQHKAISEAAMLPSTFREIYEYYKGKKLPEKTFFENTVVREFEIPREHASKCVEIFNANIERVGLVRVATSGRWLTTELNLSPALVDGITSAEAMDDVPTSEDSAEFPLPPHSKPPAPLPPHDVADLERIKRRVFVAHGKNRNLLEPIKKLLEFGELEPFVSMEKTSVSQPLPDKVFNEMRACGAAIIHVDAEQQLKDDDGNIHVTLNPNVLIEIGAAIALYGRRYILLVRDGVKLPSDLQGLFEVRYSGDTLDGIATIRLLDATKDLKNHPVPERYMKMSG